MWLKSDRRFLKYIPSHTTHVFIPCRTVTYIPFTQLFLNRNSFRHSLLWELQLYWVEISGSYFLNYKYLNCCWLFLVVIVWVYFTALSVKLLDMPVYRLFSREWLVLSGGTLFILLQTEKDHIGGKFDFVILKQGELSFWSTHHLGESNWRWLICLTEVILSHF